MSYINTIRTGYECRPLAECEFTIEFEYEPEEGMFAESFDITEVRILVPAKVGETWITLDDPQLSGDQIDALRVQAAEMYAKSRASAQSDDDRIDAEYEAWKERQLYREVE